MPPSFVRRLGAEAAGTFCLVLVGTGAIVLDQVSGGKVTHLGVSLAFGGAVMVLIWALGPQSGAHFNPAVSLGFLAGGRMTGREAAAYGLSQLAGALGASLLLSRLFPGAGTLGQTVPSGPWEWSFLLEAFMTLILILVILGIAVDSRAGRWWGGAAVGATIFLEAYFGGPISGASMNPARSFGPALVSGDFAFHWLYWAAPLSGSAVGARGMRALEGRLRRVSRKYGPTSPPRS